MEKKNEIYVRMSVPSDSNESLQDLQGFSSMWFSKITAYPTQS